MSEALRANTDGDGNVATGSTALFVNTTGENNVAIGSQALFNNNGDSNTAIGKQAGSNATAGSDNIYLGARVFGTPGESNTMYLGKVSQQTTTFIAGVRGITTGVADAVTVVIDSAGQLGTVSSSRRYKEDIQDMGRDSAGLLDLRPVTFRYRNAYADGAKPIQYGLIAEEVAEVYPDLVIYNEDGLPEAVQYRKVNAMLLNEVQGQHREIAEQQTQIDTLERQVETLLTRLASVEQRIATN